MARPREFDEQAVLSAAAEAFWTSGYEATSTRRLVQCTGLSQPSLYNAFGDKRQLFERALDHYLDERLRERIARLSALPDSAQAITTYFDEVIALSSSDAQQRGCMLVNAAFEITPGDMVFRDAVAAAMDEIRAFFTQRLQAAKEVRLPVSVDEGAALLFSVLFGMRVQARMTSDREVLRGAVRPALTLLGLPPLAS